MVRIDRVYTRGGDQGETSLGSGTRVPKDAARVEAYGTLDELNATIGCILVSSVCSQLVEPLLEIQQQLFDLGGELCVEEKAKPEGHHSSIGEDQVKSLETLMDRLSEDLQPLTSFILPGGSRSAAFLHLARTICRRAERRIQSLLREEEIPAFALAYVNRLSDALFVMARYENQVSSSGDVLWDPSRHRKSPESGSES